MFSGIGPKVGKAYRATKDALKTYFDSFYVTVSGALGTPSSGTATNLTGLPLASVVNSTSTGLGLGSIELGHASDTTIARSGVGTVTIEAIEIARNTTSQVHTCSSLELGNASDTTIARTGPGDISIEGNAVYRAGGTDVAIADGGTGASDAATALSNLGAISTGYAVQKYASPSAVTWTKPAGLKLIRVRVQANGGAGSSRPPIGSGGGGGAGGYAEGWIPAPTLPGPQPVTIPPAGTSSFGAFLSCTAGAAGAQLPPGLGGNSGIGSGPGADFVSNGSAPKGGDGFATPAAGGDGVSSYWGKPGAGGPGPPPSTGLAGGRGSGGGGGGSTNPGNPGAGGGALCIVEEFY